jgi:nucleotide-binding universal stress UspA family protein
MMAFKNILLHMDETERCKERLELALDLAKGHDSHLTGLYVIPPDFYPEYSEGIYFPQDLIDSLENENLENCAKAKQTFIDHTERHGLHGEWREEQGALDAIFSRHALYADLSIVSKGSFEDPRHYPNPALAEDVVLDTGRPILIIPNAGHFEGFGKRVLVCWNATREAARAISDAMPLLQKADKVTVLAVNPQKASSGDHGEIPCADIGLYLARHGVKIEAATVQSDISDVGEIILSRAFDIDADLIVAGAFGHSRTREWILGGVTKTLLHDSTVPTFMSH